MPMHKGTWHFVGTRKDPDPNGTPKVRVEKGTEVFVYDTGSVEEAKKLSKNLPARTGTSAHQGEPSETYEAGMSCPNYRLTGKVTDSDDRKTNTPTSVQYLLRDYTGTIYVLAGLE